MSTTPEPTFVEITTPSAIATLNDLLTNGEFRPVWTTRGEKKTQWDSLSKDERRVAILLLHGRRWSELNAELKLNPGQAEELMTSCVHKLGFHTPQEMLEHHAAVGFRVRARARGKSLNAAAPA